MKLSTILENLVQDAYERGWLDRDMNVSTDLSLFAKCAAAQIVKQDTEPFDFEAKYISDASIVRLPDGRIGVMCRDYSREGYVMVQVSRELGIEVCNGTRLQVLRYPKELAGDIIEAIMGDE